MWPRCALIVAAVFNVAGAFNTEPTTTLQPSAEDSNAHLKPVPSFFENFERSLSVVVDSGTEMCFSQEVTVGHKVSFSFHVSLALAESITSVQQGRILTRY
jgi:hypothetical protein